MPDDALTKVIRDILESYRYDEWEYDGEDERRVPAFDHDAAAEEIGKLMAGLVAALSAVVEAWNIHPMEREYSFGSTITGAEEALAAVTGPTTEDPDA